MADSARRDVELRVRAVLEGGGTLREAREEVARWNNEMRQQADRYRQLNQQLQQTIQLRRQDQQAQRGAAGGGAGGAGQQTLFGLRPYELQNLSYQLNDVVTQLASGANFSQVLAQQGGQVLQLFSRNLFSLIRFLPQIAVGIGAITIAVQALNSSLRDITAQREFTALLKTMGDGANYSATELVGLQRQVTRLGVSWAEAGQMIRAGLQTGLSQDRIAQVAAIARDVAVPHGQEPAKVFEDLAKALQEGVPGLIKWNEQVGVLDDKQLAAIRTTQRLDGVQAALRLALDQISDKTRGAADSYGMFGKELRELSNAWEEFIRSLRNTGAIQVGIDAVKGLLGTTVLLINALTDLVTLINSSTTIKWLIDNASWLRYVGPLGGINMARDAANWALGGGAGAPDPNNTGWRDAARAQQAAGLGGAAFINRLKTDTEELRQGVEALQDATRKAGLPAGYRVEVISTERPGATVAGTGTPSQHAEGKAIDVRIVDDQGRPIAGSMGTPSFGADTTGLYGKLDAAFEAAMKERFPGQFYSVGTRFQGQPDPGHYGIGRGREQIEQSAREGRGGDVTTPTSAQLDQSREALRLDNLRYDAQYDINRERARAATLAQAELEADRQKLLGAERETFINRRIFEFDNQRREVERKNQQDLANQRITDGKNAAAIDAAGAAAREKAIADAKGMLTLEQANTAEMQGREEARKRFAAEEKARNDARRINERIDERGRQLELKDLSSLEARLEALALRQKAFREEIKRGREEATGRGLPFNVNEARLGQVEASERADTTAKFYLDRLGALAQQRQEVTQAVNASVGAGAMTITEGQEAIQRAFEATTPAINDASKALQEFVATSADIDPTKADLYLAKLKQFRAEAQYISPLWKTIKETFEQSFATGISTAIDTIAQSIGGLIANTKSWGDVLRDARNAALNFFAQLLRDIAMAIIKMEALKIASAITGGSGEEGGGLLKIGLKALGVLGSAATGAPDISNNFGQVDFGGGGDITVLHRGGIVGRDGARRLAPVSWFANAPRYHNGTVLGLAANERRAILQDGEEVLAANNPRHIFNSGGGGGAINIRSILVDDPERVPAAMASSRGERIVIQHLVKNAATVRQLVKT